MSNLLHLLILISLIISKSNSFELLFEDNFNKMNETKWKVFSSEQQCKRKLTMLNKIYQELKFFSNSLNTKQLSCATNRTKNLRTISGALVLTAIKEYFANHSFTSATIITRESFNLSSSNLIFEIRVALPTTDGLSGQVLLIPEDDLKTGSINGKIFHLMNLNSSIKYGYKYNQDDFNTKPFESRTDLQEFQTYRFENYPDINHTDIYWSMNGTGFSSIDNLGFYLAQLQTV